MFDRYIITPIIAIGLAFLVWVYLRSRDQDMETAPVALEIIVDPQQAGRYVFEALPKDQVQVKFFGLPSRLRFVKDMLSQNELTIRRIIKVPYEVDQRQDNDFKETVTLDTSSLSLPLGVHAEIVSRDVQVPIVLKRMIEKTLQVRLLPAPSTDQYEIEQQRIEPENVKVFGPKSVLEGETQIILDRWQPKKIPLGLNFAPEDYNETLHMPGKIKDQPVKVIPETIEVRARLKPALRIYEINDVQIHFLCPANFPYRPQFTSERHGVLPLIKVRGPSNKSPEVRAYVDLTSRPNLKPGLYPDEPILFDLPNGYFMATDPTRLSAFKLELLDSPTKPPNTTPPQN